MQSVLNTATIPHARWIRIVTPAIIIYIVSYMDKMNIGFAMAGGMIEELRLSMAVAGVAAGMYFIGTMVLQVPAGHIAEHGSATKFIQYSIIAWGGLSFLTGFVQNAWQLIAMRFLLGVAEGGVYPVVLILVSNWFPRKELGRANALCLMGLALAAVLTDPLCQHSSLPKLRGVVLLHARDQNFARRCRRVSQRSARFGVVGCILTLFTLGV